MAEIIAATASELLEGVASIPPQGQTQTYAEWAAEQAFEKVVSESAAGYEAPIYRWNLDPAAEEAFSKIVDETSADGAWEAWKSSDGFVNPSGSAAPSPTVKASPQTAIKGAGGAATAGGLLSMSLPTWVAAAAPLLGVAVGVGLYELSPSTWEKISRALLPFCYDDSEAMPVVTDEDGNTYIDKEAVEALKDVFDEEGIGPQYQEGTTTYNGQTVHYVTLSRIDATNGNYYILSKPARVFSVKTGSNAQVMAWAKNGLKVYEYRADGTLSRTINGNFVQDSSVWYNVSIAWQSYLSTQVPYNGQFDWGTDQRQIGQIFRYGTDGESGGFVDGTSKWTGTTVDIGTLPTKEVFTDTADDTKTRDFIPVALPTQPGQSVDPTTNPDPTTNADPEEQISPYIMPTIPKEQYPDGSDTEDTQDLDKNAPIPTPIPNQNPTPDPEADPSQPSEEPPPTGQIVDPIPPIDIGDFVPPGLLPTGGAAPTGADGGVGGLVSVYNPTYAELSSFAQWLWVTYADATIDKIWNNPFDGIISLHELYATPNVGGRKYIKSGFLVSPVESDTIPDRYSEINCGTAIFPEYYGNYLDYSPYSKALVYLPFIGIEELNVDDIVGHAVNITYRVDSYSGACIALITCAKEGSNAVFYQFCGNCSVQLPIAGGTQAAIKAAQISAGAYQNAYHVAGVAGLAGGLANGIGSLFSGSLGGVLGGVVNGIGSYMVNQAQGEANSISQTVSAKSSVQHSGQFGESFGAMGNKKPYMIIKRPVQVRVPNYQAEYGYPAHKYVTIGECEGYIRCRGIHVASARATDSERQMIEQALTEGVYVT